MNGLFSPGLPHARTWVGFFFILLAAVTLAAATPLAASDFAVRDGDTVTFLGDSITAALVWTRVCC